MGSTNDAAGFAVAVDGSDNVVIAGQTSDVLTETAYGGNYDSFVTKYDEDGRELWTRQAQPFAADGGLALDIDSSDNIFLAGYARAAIGSGVSHAGGSDGFTTKIDSDGVLVYNKQFGTSGEDRATAIAVDDAGNFYVTAERNGNAVLLKYADSSASQTPIWEVDLGAFGVDGGVTGLAVGSGGAVYLSGHTDNASLTGPIVTAHSGGSDGFVTRILDSGSSAAVDWTSYVGSSATDKIQGLAVRADVAGDEVYLTGSTAGSIGGQSKVGDTDGFAVKLNSSGTLQWAHQFGGAFDHSANAAVFDLNGTSVLSRLGLPAGPLPLDPPGEIINLTSARAGQSFQISVNGGAFSRVTIENDDNFGFLGYKMNRILGKYGFASYEKDTDGMHLSIEALQGGRIEIKGGVGGLDALPALGLREVVLFDDTATSTEFDSDDDSDDENETAFALGLIDDMNVLTDNDSGDAVVVLEDAMRAVRNAYKKLVGIDDDALLDRLAAQALSPENQARINAMQFALARLTQLAQNPLPTVSLKI